MVSPRLEEAGFGAKRRYSAEFGAYSNVEVSKTVFGKRQKLFSYANTAIAKTAQKLKEDRKT